MSTVDRSQLLVVCEGNICRSPLAAVLLESLAVDVPDISVSSAGLRAVVGSGMDRQAAEEAARFSLDSSSHVARRLTESMIQESAVILTMSVEQRTRVVQLAPLAMRRTFTLKEFAIVAQNAPDQKGSGAAHLRAIAKWGDLARASHKNHDLDIDDPYRREDSVHRRVADEIRMASELVAARINT